MFLMLYKPISVHTEHITFICIYKKFQQEKYKAWSYLKFKLFLLEWSTFINKKEIENANLL